MLQEFADSDTTTVDISKTGVEIDRSQLPECIIHPGLSLDRQTYLYEQIRVFCEPKYADVTCPMPTSSRPEASTGTVVPPSKRIRPCSHCKQPGHTKTVRGKTTCPKLLN